MAPSCLDSSPRKWKKWIPTLVTRNDKGEAETVRYEAVNAMLLNEFLKEHRKVEEQKRPSRQSKECKRLPRTAKAN